MSVRILIGDCREKLRGLPDASVHCCVTSPPYFGLRDYGTAQWEGGALDCDHKPKNKSRATRAASGLQGGIATVDAGNVQRDCHCGAKRIDRQMGLEPTPDEFVAGMMEVFREVRRVLRDDGTLWLNIGDSYAASTKGAGGQGKQHSNAGSVMQDRSWRIPDGLKPKDLIGIPWRLAKALQEPYYTGRIKRLEDRVWLAAMIDGEGCLFIHKRKAGADSGAKFTKADGTVRSYRRTQDTYGCGLEVANTSRAIVERCLQITGVGSICEQTKDRRQTLYRWNVRSNECRWIIEEVYPHLVGKQHQARLLLGCPSSGKVAADAHSALIYLHNGLEVTTDFPPPKSLFEPGWYLRQDIIWSKCNPMPESVRDRCTKAHEYLFLLSKGPRYYFNAEAIAEASSEASGWAKQRAKGENTWKYNDSTERKAQTGQNVEGSTFGEFGSRNKRSVWEVATQPFSEAHFATYPPALIEPCILAGCPTGGTVLDPFGGAGTTGLVADRLGRNAILVELNAEYAAIAERRLTNDAGLFAEVKAA